MENGGCPDDGLIFDAAGNLYGTSWGALAGPCDLNGNVFQLTRQTNGKWQETVLFNFSTEAAGLFPSAGLIFDAAGNLYGTTPFGGGESGCPGGFGCGTVFELVRGGTGWSEVVLHRFPDSLGDGTVALGRRCGRRSREFVRHHLRRWGSV